MTEEVSIKIGEQPDDFLKRYPDKIKIQKQPAGLDFYSIDWDSMPRGVVTIDHGKHAFTLSDVMGIQTHTNVDLLSEGFYEYTIFAGITPEDLIPHAQARDKIYALLKQIEARGWRSITSRSRPRLTGKDRLNYALNTSTSVGLDTKYIPTLEEWMKIENLTSWNFYADHQYLTVDFQRESSLTDPEKPGAYLLSFSLKSEVEQFKGYVDSLDRERWKTLLAAEIQKLSPQRTEREAALKAQGIPIDETYQDPPLPAFMQ